MEPSFVEKDRQTKGKKKYISAYVLGCSTSLPRQKLHSSSSNQGLFLCFCVTSLQVVDKLRQKGPAKASRSPLLTATTGYRHIGVIGLKRTPTLLENATKPLDCVVLAMDNKTAYSHFYFGSVKGKCAMFYGSSGYTMYGIGKFCGVHNAGCTNLLHKYRTGLVGRQYFVLALPDNQQLGGVCPYIGWFVAYWSTWVSSRFDFAFDATEGCASLSSLTKFSLREHVVHPRL